MLDTVRTYGAGNERSAISTYRIQDMQVSSVVARCSDSIRKAWNRTGKSGRKKITIGVSGPGCLTILKIGKVENQRSGRIQILATP
jgi:hypothetical protein